MSTRNHNQHLEQKLTEQGPIAHLFLSFFFITQFQFCLLIYALARPYSRSENSKFEKLICSMRKQSSGSFDGRRVKRLGGGGSQF